MEEEPISEYYSPNVLKIFDPINEQKQFNLSTEAFINLSRLDFDLLLSEISSKLTLNDINELDTIIEITLQRILEFLKLDVSALLYEKEDNNETFPLRCLKVRPEYDLQLESLPTIDSFPWIFGQVLRGHEIIYSGIHELPPEAFIDKKTLRESYSDHSAVVIPLADGGKINGILIVAVAEIIKWPKEVVSLLRIAANIFSGVLIRKKMTKELQRSQEQLKLTKAMLEKESICVCQDLKISCSLGDFIYKSEEMIAVLNKVKQVASTNSTVLLCGETGTGKELIASEIHNMSSRSYRKMVRVNCGAIPSALVESEMFGREKGAYTGALSQQIGRFELADKSTIFLDEITDLPMEVQVKLLRVLQEKEIERLGNPKPIKVDVRIIAATNQNLEKALRDGKFREDLYYRLNVFPIEIPPLRERPEDIPLLVWHFIDKLSYELEKKVERVSTKSMDALMEYSWPGNVRELRNAIERAMIVLNSPVLHIDIPHGKPSVENSTPHSTMKDIEIQHIRRVLESTAWKIRGEHGAAKILGMKPTTLETRMAKLGIHRPD